MSVPGPSSSAQLADDVLYESNIFSLLFGDANENNNLTPNLSSDFYSLGQKLQFFDWNPASDSIFTFGRKWNTNLSREMMGLVGNQQPMDYSASSLQSQSVLDLRTVKNEPDDRNLSYTTTRIPPPGQRHEAITSPPPAKRRSFMYTPPEQHQEVSRPFMRQHGMFLPGGHYQEVVPLPRQYQTVVSPHNVFPPYHQIPPPPEAVFCPSTSYVGNFSYQVYHGSSEDSSEGGSISPDERLVTSPTHSQTAAIPCTISAIVGRSGKPTRPFKAYPKDPLSITALSAADAVSGVNSTDDYAEYRRNMLAQIQAMSTSGTSNSKMKRPVSPKEQNQEQTHQNQSEQQQTQPQPSSCTDKDGKDAAYWERRRKNNEAAKRSRDARRAKEDEIAIRATYLENENVRLKYENANLKTEADKLRSLVKQVSRGNCLNI